MSHSPLAPCRQRASVPDGWQAPAPVPEPPPMTANPPPYNDPGSGVAPGAWRPGLNPPANCEIGLYTAAQNLTNTPIENLEEYIWRISILDSEIAHTTAHFMEMVEQPANTPFVEFVGNAQRWCTMLGAHYRCLVASAEIYVDRVEAEQAAEARLARGVAAASLGPPSGGS